MWTIFKDRTTVLSQFGSTCTLFLEASPLKALVASNVAEH